MSHRTIILTCAMACFLGALTSSAQNKPDPLAGALPRPIEQLQADSEWRVYAAVITHDHKTLQSLLDSGDSPNGARDLKGNPLVMACQLSDLDAVKILVKAGAEIDRSDPSNVNALYAAIGHNQPEIVSYLLDHGVQVNGRSKYNGETPLFHVLRYHNMKLLTVLFKAGADANLRNNDGDTPLMIASYADDYDLVKFLKANGAKFTSPNEELIFAAIQGDVAEIQRLLAAGAKVNQSYRYDRTPLMLAAGNGQTAAVKALIAAGADINARDNEHDTPLVFAIMSRHKSTILALLDAGADLNISNNYGGTALSEVAMLLDDPDLVHLLIRHGASVDGIGSPTQFTPLMAAASSGGLLTVQILLDAHVPVDAQTTEGLTALMEAATSGQADILTLLLRAGADPSIKDEKGRTALDWAMEEHQQAAVDVLRKPPPPTTTRK